MPVTIISKSSENRKYRINFFGYPYSGKTTGLSTFNDEGKVCIINCPGEKGTESIPEGDSFTNFIFEYATLGDEVSQRDSFNLTKEILEAFLAQTRGVLKGDQGEFSTVAFDGLLKLQEHFIDYASLGAYFKGVEFDTRRVYPKASALFTNFLSEIYYSQIPVIATTTWARYDFAEENMSEREQTDITKQGGKKLWPNLIGKMAHQILGEFNASIYCTFEMFTKCASCQVAMKKGEGQIKEEHRVWQLAPSGDVYGVGIKDRRKEKRFPLFIHQDWKILKALMA